MQPPRQVICDLLNRILAREPAVLALLAEHAGQTFRLVADPVDATITIAHDGRLSAADVSNVSIVPDVTLKIDTRELWASGWRPGQPVPERAGLVQVSGDAALAQTLSMLAKSWRVDPEDLLSSVVGDVAAVQLVGGVKRLATLATQFVTRTTENVAEYAVHESHVLVGQSSQQTFKDDLAALIDRLDACGARVQSLSDRVGQSQDVGGQA